MRFHTTLAFSTALATATTLRRPEDESEAAGREADAAVEAVLMMPATTPKEVSQKIALIEDRYGAVTIDDLKAEMAALRADMDRLIRQPVSQEMADAFATYATAHEAHDKCEGLEDESPEAVAIYEAAGAAERALMAVPCTTPGDFMVKAYIDLLGRTGGTYRSHEPSRSHGFVFEVEALDPDDYRAPDGSLQHDAQAEISLRYDLMQSDLGACLFALGRVDFDAEAWIAAADRWGHGFYVTVDAAGNATGFGQNLGASGDRDNPGWTSERETLLMRLLAGGLDISSERIKAVVEATIANHPAHVHQPAEAEAA